MHILPKRIRKWPVLLAMALTSVLVIVGCGGHSSSSSSGSNVTATPAFNPGAGTYNKSQTVTISDTTPGAVLYCTTDGTQPTTSSPVCSQPTTVYKTEFLQAIAVAPGKSASAVASAGYTINLNAAATPTFNPAGGTYSGTQQVTINDETSGANLYYTLDGNVPTANSTLYTGAVTISKSATLSAIAVASGYANSGVNSAVYTIQAQGSAPVITGLSTSSGPVGTSVTISGNNFGASQGSNSTVTFGGVAATVSSGNWSNSSITTTVPANATTGAVVVTVNNVASNNNFTFTVTGAPTSPVITGLSTSSGPVGTSVTITGNNFGSSQSNGTVTFGGVVATVSSGNWSNSSITTTVPANATTGAVVVTVNNVASNNNFTFTVTSAAPVITGLSTSTGPVGTSVTISGNNFGSSQSNGTVTFDGVVATVSSGNWSNGSITTTVPANATTGAVVVTVNNVASNNNFTFTVTGAPTSPVITGLSTSSGPVGTSVTISGNNFGASQGSSSTVTFGGVAATVSSGNWSNSSITTTVPANSTTGAVVVTVNNVASNDDFTFTVTAALPTISGTVSSAGASVQLYAAGTSGYGYGASGPTKVVGSAATADPTTGQFSGIAYDCSALTAPGDQLYLIATGPNNQVVLMTALGSCGSLSTSGTTVTINEVTTIASAYALSGFAAFDTANGGIDIGAPATYDATNAPKCDASPDNWQSTGPNTCNYIGLQNAFKTVNNLVNIGNGQALTITPYYANLGATSGDVLNSSYVPQARINSLANLLAPCVQGTSSCSTLFNAAGNSSLKDTLQAALYIAQHPGANVATLYAVQTAEATLPYKPALTSAPDDWTIALTFTGGGLGVSPSVYTTNPALAPQVQAMAIDATGHLWLAVTNGCENLTTYASVPELVEFDNQGNAVSPAATSPDYCGGYQPQYNGSPALANGSWQVLAFDQSGKPWLTNASSSGGLVQLSSDGQTVMQNVDLHPSSGFQLLGFCPPGSLAADAAGKMWVGCVYSSSQYGGVLGFDTSSGTIVGATDHYYYPSSPSQIRPIAELQSISLDPLGNLWGATDPSFSQTTAYNSDLFQFSISDPTKPAVSDDYATSGRTFANTVVADGAGNVFSSSPTLGTINVLQNGTWSSFTYPVPSSAPSDSHGLEQLAIDGVGNLWGSVWPGDINSPVAYGYLIQISSSGNRLSPSTSSVYGYTGTGGGGESQAILPNSISGSNNPSTAGVAVDASGNVWMATQTFPWTGFAPSGTPVSQQLVEFVGVAAPVTTPAVQALANTALGARP